MVSLPSTALEPSRYLAVFRADGDRLADVAAAGGLGAKVPACPGWTVGDVVTHTSGVYRRQGAVIRLGRRPAQDEWEPQPVGARPLHWFRASLQAMLDELESRDPGSAALTRCPHDPTVGFWYRRMALETVVHRVDVEQALGAPTPVDEALATDGIDEVLTVFLRDGWAGPPDPAAQDPGDRSIAVRAGGLAWLCRAEAASMAVTRISERDLVNDMPDATVRGSAASVLLWLWGRAPDGDVHVDGDPSFLQAFRTRLAMATT